MANRSALVAGLILFFSLPAGAQTDYPPLEVSAGYAFTQLDTLGFFRTPSLHGWGASLAGNFNRYLGFTADISGQYGQLEATLPTPILCIAIFPPPPGCVRQVSPDISSYQFLFGPRVTGRTQRFTVFAHALAGAVQTRIGSFSFQLPPPLPPLIIPFPATSDNNFALGFGGGVDVRTSRQVAVRTLQFDYIPVHASRQWLHHVRFKSGIVVRFSGP